MNAKPRFLMCPPDKFDVGYVINPWMEGNVHKSSPELAASQWHALRNLLSETAEVALIDPRAGLPDMVFTANAGLAVGKRFVLSRFLHRERQGEEPLFKKWFQPKGFEVFELPDDLPFEGAGDALMDRERGLLWAGYGFRSELDSHPLLAKWLKLEVISLRLIDPRFYHLDTCFCPLEGGWLLYFPQAFDAYSNRAIEQRVPSEKRIAVNEADASHFACNAVNIGQRVIVNQTSSELRAQLEAAGFTIARNSRSREFREVQRRCAKCLTLCLHRNPEPAKIKIADQRPQSRVKTRRAFARFRPA